MCLRCVEGLVSSLYAHGLETYSWNKSRPTGPKLSYYLIRNVLSALPGGRDTGQIPISAQFRHKKARRSFPRRAAKITGCFSR
jgi:hypothetical protein